MVSHSNYEAWMKSFEKLVAIYQRKSYNLLIYFIYMDPKLEEVSRWLIWIFYNDYEKDRYISSNIISNTLRIDEATVIKGLKKLLEAELVETSITGYRLSKKGYMIAYNQATTFCPHL